MIINLGKYEKEAHNILLAAKPFTVAESNSVLDEIKSALTTGLESRKGFNWKTKRAIILKPATDYDRRTGTAKAATIKFNFNAHFSPPARRQEDWRVDELTTELKVFGDNADNPALHLHVDKKNNSQRGPHAHIQVSEECTKRLGMKLAVPRIPFGFLLPTDCLDFVLAEFFPDEWGQAQVGAQGIRLICDAQRQRAINFSRKLEAEWAKHPKKSPVSVLQDCSLGEDLRLA